MIVTIDYDLLRQEDGMIRLVDETLAGGGEVHVIFYVDKESDVTDAKDWIASMDFGNDNKPTLIAPRLSSRRMQTKGQICERVGSDIHYDLSWDHIGEVRDKSPGTLCCYMGTRRPR